MRATAVGNVELPLKKVAVFAQLTKERETG